MHKSPSSSSSSSLFFVFNRIVRNSADLLPQQYANQPNLHTGNEEWVLFEVNMFPYQCIFFKLLSKIFNLFLPLNVINRVIAGPLPWSKLNIARLSFLYLCSFTLALSVRLSTHTNVVISSISQWFFFFPAEWQIILRWSNCKSCEENKQKYGLKNNRAHIRWDKMSFTDKLLLEWKSE